MSLYFIKTAAQTDEVVVMFSLLRAQPFDCSFVTFVRVIKFKSVSVETRKMVNYARTWLSQVKT